jgi:hypothetical protein
MVAALALLGAPFLAVAGGRAGAARTVAAIEISASLGAKDTVEERPTIGQTPACSGYPR